MTLEPGRTGLDRNRSFPAPIAMGSQVHTFQCKSAQGMGIKRAIYAQ